VQARMGQLAQRMDQIDPGLRPAADIQNLVHAVNTMQNIRKIGGGVPAPPNPPSFPEARRGNAAPASPDTGGTLHPVFRRPMPPRRRPFLPE
jgi:hypothetical protein